MTTIFAHRGSAGTHPENTMASFLEAEQVGTDGIELDVQMTKDKKLVIIHDEMVNRTTNGNGWVKDFSLKELRELDAGSWFSKKFRNEQIPTMEEVLIWMQDNDLDLNIELKNGLIRYEGLEERVLEMVQHYDMLERVILSSFNHYSVEKVHELNPWIDCAVLFMEGLYEPWDYAKKIGATALHPYWKAASAEMIAGAIKANMKIRPFTINQEQHMKELIIAGCTGIMTDFPERALNVRTKIEQE